MNKMDYIVVTLDLLVKDLAEIKSHLIPQKANKPVRLCKHGSYAGRCSICLSSKGEV